MGRTRLTAVVAFMLSIVLGMSSLGSAASLPLQSVLSAQLDVQVSTATGIIARATFDISNALIGSLSVVPLLPTGQYADLRLESLTYVGSPISIAGSFGLFDIPVAFSLSEISWSSSTAQSIAVADPTYATFDSVAGQAIGTLAVGIEIVGVILPSVGGPLLSTTVPGYGYIPIHNLRLTGAILGEVYGETWAPAMTEYPVTVNGVDFDLQTRLHVTQLIFVPEPSLAPLCFIALSILVFVRLSWVYRVRIAWP